MVKTSDFESENSGSSPGEAAKLVAAYDELMKYARISIKGDTATLIWPETTSDYYGGGYMEQQHASFPSEMLLWPMDALKHWKAEETRKEEAKQAAERKRYDAQRVAEQERNERAALALLKAKYGG